ncbi:MAG: divalent-cation tolerance protein CutA [candidate division KSB1 bacterium]|nr:divalent-cation tolerance protein CutA [candidate division KSB1 bacterium]MDZ7303279.1 divalent-cation tolerance protein CutA [candidate division KSB1 bacterium]MDZ7312583.1 divalent-cation tolerance protein CutA [candidate division KSB1 bacterium]
MNERAENIVVLMTAANEEEGAKLAKLLVETRLAACVSLVPQARSFFWWEGKMDEQSETIMIVKTRRQVLSLLIETVQKHHSYSVPEIIALPIIDGAANYLNWLAAEVRS